MYVLVGVLILLFLYRWFWPKRTYKIKITQVTVYTQREGGRAWIVLDTELPPSIGNSSTRYLPLYILAENGLQYARENFPKYLIRVRYDPLAEHMN